MMITEKRTKVLLAALLESEFMDQCNPVTRSREGIEHEYVSLVSSYGEPGYTCENGVLLGNWNSGSCILSATAQAYLENAGFKLEWDDEWVEIDNKLYLTSPTHYGRLPTAVVPPESCEYVTPAQDASDVIKRYEVENSLSALDSLPYWITEGNLIEAGYTLWNKNEKYESGFHDGQTDEPQKIAERLLGLADVDFVVFQITESGQFDMSFNAWVRSANS